MNDTSKKQKAVICDLDGTLCNNIHRLHYIDANRAEICQLIEWYHDEKNNDEFYVWKGTTKKWEPDYAKYLELMGNDTMNQWCADILLGLFWLAKINQPKILFVTARPEQFRDVTYKWIENHTQLMGHGAQLFMRPNEYDVHSKILPTYNFKEITYTQKIKPKYDVLFVLEDDMICASMYRNQKLTVLLCK